MDVKSPLDSFESLSCNFYKFLAVALKSVQEATSFLIRTTPKGSQMFGEQLCLALVRISLPIKNQVCVSFWGALSPCVASNISEIQIKQLHQTNVCLYSSHPTTHISASHQIAPLPSTWMAIEAAEVQFVSLH